MAWENDTRPFINTPKGKYFCETNDLETEVKAAMTSAGYTEAKFFLNGLEVPDADHLPVREVSAVIVEMRLEPVEGSEVEIGSIAAHAKAA